MLQQFSARPRSCKRRSKNPSVKRPIWSVPLGYRRTKPKLGAFMAIIDTILAKDKTRPQKLQHTAKRTFERLRDEYGFTAASRS